MTKLAESGRDFTDGTDAKKATAIKSGKTKSGRTRWKARISNIKNKTGGIRAVVDTFPVTGRPGWVYIALPYSTYRYCGEKFTFELDNDGKVTGMYERYVVDSLETLAETKFENGQIILNIPDIPKEPGIYDTVFDELFI